MKIALNLFFTTVIFWTVFQNIELIKDETTFKPNLKKEEKGIGIEQLNHLIPVEIVEAKNNDVYKKYGLEFSGNCYACDLANLSITAKSIKLTNVCDEKSNQVYKIIKIKNNENEIFIKTKQHDFTLTKIDKAPIFELKIIGNKIKIKNLRISKYYTLKKILKKFEQHDCGDFDG